MDTAFVCAYSHQLKYNDMDWNFRKVPWKRAVWRGVGMTAVVAVLPFSACSVGTLFHEELIKEKAMVLLTDSTRYSGRTLLPDCRGCSFRFVTDEGRRIRIKSETVEQLRFRKGNAMAGAFIYAPYTRPDGMDGGMAWMNCPGQGPHLKLALLAGGWQFTRKGELAGQSFADGSVYIIAFKDGGKGQYVATLGRMRKMLGKALCKLLADDPQLCEKIVTGEVDAYDFQEICRQYRPRGEADGIMFEVRIEGTDEDAFAGKGGAA